MHCTTSPSVVLLPVDPLFRVRTCCVTRVVDDVMYILLYDVMCYWYCWPPLSVVLHSENGETVELCGCGEHRENAPFTTLL